ncbi:MAG: HAD-IIA family hydrolase [Actinomycetota bacterium]
MAGEGALRELDGLVCDLDGVMYRGSEPIPGSPEAVGRLRRLGVSVVFCTNNANPTIGRYVEKLTDMGVEVAPEQLVTSAVVLAEVLSGEGAAGKSAIVVGGDGLREALRSIDVVVDDDPSSRSADYVAVGFDPGFTYDALKRASFAVQAGAELVAANVDASFPAPDGLWPGSGAIVASIEVASGGRARVMGKPHEPMMRVAQRHLGDASRIAIVGDRPNTDLEGGRAMGWTTILVLSGVTSREDVDRIEPAPDVIVDRLDDLVTLLDRTRADE